MILTHFKQSGKVTRNLLEASVLGCGALLSGNGGILSGVTLGGYIGRLLWTYLSGSGGP